MIFVCLGTNDKSFVRLLEEVDKQINVGNIKDEVVVQAGCTKYASSNMTIVDLMSMREFSGYIKKCDLLICHGGVGTILDGLKNNKKIIAFPRLSKYGEHVNDHQVEIINEFYNSGYILTGDVDDLDKLLIKSKDFEVKKYKSNNYKFNKIIIDYIDNL